MLRCCRDTSRTRVDHVEFLAHGFVRGGRRLGRNSARGTLASNMSLQARRDEDGRDEHLPDLPDLIVESTMVQWLRHTRSRRQVSLKEVRPEHASAITDALLCAKADQASRGRRQSTSLMTTSLEHFPLHLRNALKWLRRYQSYLLISALARNRANQNTCHFRT